MHLTYAFVGRAKNYPYSKSKLRNFFGSLYDTGEVVYWDKRFIKQKINGLPIIDREGLSLKCCTTHHKNECELYNLDGETTYHFIRALLGLESTFEFQTDNRDKKFVVSVSSSDIERFQSIVIFIVKNKTVYTCIKPKEELKKILNQKFVFKMTIKDKRFGNSLRTIELGEISTPTLSDKQIDRLYTSIAQYFQTKPNNKNKENE